MGDGAVPARVVAGETAEALDALALGLRALREATGVSYREIAARITRRREQEGIAPAAAVVAHSTVSDAFRPGRARINADLVAEIVRALGADDTEAARWRERCIRAMTGGRRTAEAPTGRIAPGGPTAAVASRPMAAPIVILVVAALLLNASGEFLNPLLGDVLFLDMIGTAVTAILLGPWWAVLVGLLFVAVEVLKADVGHALFATTMLSAGLIWGYGVHRLDLGRTLPRFIGLSAAVAVTTTAIAVPVTVLYFHGSAGRGADGFVLWATGAGADLWAAIGASNISVSLVDKILTGVIAYYAAPLVGQLLHLTPDATDSSSRRP